MTDEEKQFENFVRVMKFDDEPNPTHRDKLETQLLAAMAKQPRQESRPIQAWRIIMKSPITKLAAAAVVIIAMLYGVAGTFAYNIDNCDQITQEHSQLTAQYEQLKNEYEQSYKTHEQTLEKYKGTEKEYEQMSKKHDQIEKEYAKINERYNSLYKIYEQAIEQYKQSQKAYAQLTKEYERTQKGYEQTLREYKLVRQTSRLVLLLTVLCFTLPGIIFVYVYIRNKDKDRNAITDIIRSEFDKRIK